MAGNSTNQARSTAIKQLQAFGLSTYAARTFVALVSLGEGSAQDVSEVVDVPRTRVYDAVEELQQRGVVDVQESTPKRFWTVSAEIAGRQFEREYEHRAELLVEALDSLEPISRSTEQRGVWTVTGRETVTERVIDFIETADNEVVYMTVDELLTERIITQLQAASDRGVAIKLGTMSKGVEERFHNELPDAEIFESLWTWSDTPTGRLLMVDEKKRSSAYSSPILKSTRRSHPLKRRSGDQGRPTVWWSL